MDIDVKSSRRSVLGSLFAAGILVGCASAPTDPAVQDARAAVNNARNHPAVAKHAEVQLHEAEQALRAAEKAESEADAKRLAYTARRRAEIAMVVADRGAAVEERERLLQEKDQLVLQSRDRQLEQARLDAQTKAQEAETKAREAQMTREQLAAEQARAQQLQQQATTTQEQLQAEQARAQQLQQQATTSQEQLQAEQARFEQAHEEAERAREQLQEQQNIATIERRSLAEQLKEFQSRQTERGMSLTLSGVVFETGKAELLSGSTLSLTRLAEVLKQNPNQKVVIEGHTDSRGSYQTNQQLSQRRAEAVRQALIQLGVPPESITARGLGPDHPIASNDTAAGRQLNRRVDIVLVDEGTT